MDSLDTLVLARSDTLVLGRYRLLERLGAGGFGVVWSAHDEHLQREVALKRIFLPTEDHDSIAERAQREAQAAARLSHPAIVALYEARSEGEAFYLISELVQGDTLATLIAEDALSDEEVLGIGAALASALEHAHARGVIHRDVKPQNILVPDDPDAFDGHEEHDELLVAFPVSLTTAPAKLTDFGGARLAGEDVLTRTGDVLGTLAYMAPEQSEGRRVTAQADLYSLALVLYEALSGVNPVRGANPAATARRIGSRLERLERYRRDLPRALTRALDAALVADPAQRGTLGELREALESGPRQGAGRARRIAGTATTPQRPRPPLREGRLVPPASHSAHSHDPHLHVHGPYLHSQQHHHGQEHPHLQKHQEHLHGQQDIHSQRPARSPQIPRAIWAAATVALVLWQAAAGRPGVALLLLAAAVPLLIAPRTSPLALVAAGAPALGMVGLAGAFPALAGQGTRWPARAALGALGYWWLCLAEPLLGRRLWLGLPGGWATAPGAHAAWVGSLNLTAEHVLVAMATLGVLLGAALWAAAAVLLPWLVRGRNAALDVIAATVWAAALLAALPLLERGLPGAVAHADPRGAVLGVLLGGALAVVARALRGPV